ncbi:MAG: hypothetical protein V7L00_23055 [Nostoc sp.]|uniref:hypothetical protein n=1 Tax=Nostoc sp. TaxID=1180 RepID=UPI002FF9B2FF
MIAKDVEEGDRVAEAQISDELRPAFGDRIGDQDANTSKAVRETLAASTWGSVLVLISTFFLNPKARCNF